MADHILRTEIEESVKAPCRSAEEMEELCCKATNKLQCCEKAGPWTGYTDEEICDRLGIELDENGKDENGYRVIIERKPRKHPCGKMVTKYNLDPKNCCDEVGPLENPNGDFVIGDNSYALIRVNGGKETGPFTWKVRKAGVYFDANHSIRDAQTEGPAIYIYTTDVCGTIPIQVTDGCTSLTINIRAEKGQWVLVQYWDYDTHFASGVVPPPCIGGAADIEVNGESGQQVSFRNAGYLYRESITYNKNVFYGGSPYTGYPDWTWEDACNATISGAASKTAGFCSDLQPPFNGSMTSDCCDSSRCYPDVCGASCYSSYCFYCGNQMRYIYYGEGGWRGYAPSLWRAWLYKWEC